MLPKRPFGITSKLKNQFWVINGSPFLLSLQNLLGWVDDECKTARDQDGPLCVRGFICYPKCMDTETKSVLVYVGLDRIGDSLLKLPFVRGLREAFPGAHITWVAGKDTSVYAGNMSPFVKGLLDEVIENAGIGLSPKELLRRPLNSRYFDIIFDTQRVALATLVLCRIRHGQFISPFGNFFLSSRKPPSGYKFPQSMQRQMLDLLEIATDQKIKTPNTLPLQLEPSLLPATQQLLPEGPTYVGLLPGSGGKPKCWPLRKFIQLAQIQTVAGRVPVFLLGPQEKQWRPEIAAVVPEAIFPLQDGNHKDELKHEPQWTIALSKRIAVSVSNDSGAGHMCAVGGQPLVSLFGRTSPAKFKPMTPKLTIIKAQDYGGREMHFIPVDAVDSAVKNAINGVYG